MVPAQGPLVARPKSEWLIIIKAVRAGISSEFKISAYKLGQFFWLGVFIFKGQFFRTVQAVGYIMCPTTSESRVQGQLGSWCFGGVGASYGQNLLLQIRILDR